MKKIVVFIVCSIAASISCAAPKDWYGDRYDEADKFVKVRWEENQVTKYICDHYIVEKADGTIDWALTFTAKHAFRLAADAAQNAMDAKLAAKNIADKLDKDAVVEVSMSAPDKSGNISLTYKTTNLGDTSGKTTTHTAGNLKTYRVKVDAYNNYYLSDEAGNQCGAEWQDSFPCVDKKSLDYNGNSNDLQLASWKSPPEPGHTLSEMLTTPASRRSDPNARILYRDGKGFLQYATIGYIETNGTSSASTPPDNASIKTWSNNETNYLTIAGFHDEGRSANRIPVASGTGDEAVLSWWNMEGDWDATVDCIFDTREFEKTYGNKNLFYNLKGFNDTDTQSIPYRSGSDDETASIAWSGTPSKAGAILTKVGSETTELEWSSPDSGGMYYGTAQGSDGSSGASWCALPTIPHDFAPTNGTYYTDGLSINTNAQGRSQIYGWAEMGDSTKGLLYKDGTHPVLLSNAVNVAVAPTNGLEFVRIPGTTDNDHEKAVGLLGWQNGTATNCGITVKELLTDSTVSERNNHFVMMKYVDSMTQATTIHYAALGDIIKTNASATAGFTGAFSAFAGTNNTTKIMGGYIMVGRTPVAVQGKTIDATWTDVSIKVVMSNDGVSGSITPDEIPKNPSATETYIPLYKFSNGTIVNDYRGCFTVNSYDE